MKQQKLNPFIYVFHLFISLIPPKRQNIHKTKYIKVQPSQDIFETLDNISEKDFPVKFMENLMPILEHAKIEIIEFLHSFLKKTRDIVFEELVTKIPELLDREMYARKNWTL